MGTQQEIDRVALLVDGRVHVFPVAFDLDIGLVHAPAPAGRALDSPKCLFEQGYELDDPPVYARVIDLNSPLGDHFFEVAQAQRVRHVPANTQQNHIQRIVQALENLADPRRRRHTR